MISCLICASSILLVAGAFIEAEDKYPNHPSSTATAGNSSSSQDYLHDADTCLKVFEALSVNSEAAQKATDMLKGLTRLRSFAKVSSVPMQLSRARPTNSNERGPTNNNNPSSLVAAHQTPLPLQVTSSHVMNDPITTLNPIDGDDPTMRWPQQWPSEMSNTMEWSAQFLNPLYGFADNNNQPSAQYNMNDDSWGHFES